MCVFVVWNLETRVFTVSAVVRVCHLLIPGVARGLFVSFAWSIPAAFRLTLTGPTRPSEIVKRWTAVCRKIFNCLLGPDVSLKLFLFSFVLCRFFCFYRKHSGNRRF